jgi:hypothetical protein
MNFFKFPTTDPGELIGYAVLILIAVAVIVRVKPLRKIAGL